MTDETSPFPVRSAGGLTWIAARALEGLPMLRHWFLARTGGGSRGPYESLNLGAATGDDPDAVRKNRKAAWDALGLAEAPVSVRQVHGNGVEVVDCRNLAHFRREPPEADAMITVLRGVPLMVLTADCLPIVVCDARTPALGLAHAGWRGTVRSVLWKTVLTMADAFGTDPADCVAAVGPGIAAECYEVGEDVREAFVKGLPYGQDVLRPAGEFRWKADLGEANRRQLLDARVPSAKVHLCPRCTHCEPELFFSARRDGSVTGRQAAVAMLS